MKKQPKPKPLPYNEWIAHIRAEQEKTYYQLNEACLKTTKKTIIK